jgi:gamma-glutamyltranspeptidase/glutathione hydrolase
MKFTFDPDVYRFPSQRHVVYGKNGMVATGNPLAAEAGLDSLKKGGNAVDAAIAAAATLAVVEPNSNGLGSDAFAIVYNDGRFRGINGSGPAPKSMTIDAMKEKGYDSVPFRGTCSITVPGAVATWWALHDEYGYLEFAEDLKPAIRYASEGFVLQPNVGQHMSKLVSYYQELAKEDEVYNSLLATFGQFGNVPKTGDFLCLPYTSMTLQEIAATGRASFYEGRVAEWICKYVKDFGGFLSEEDMAAFHPQWVDPISTTYGGLDVRELPPNGQGIAVLMAMNILKQLPNEDATSFESVHAQIEAMKLALTDAKTYVTDPDYMKVSTDYLLSEDYAKARAAEIGDTAIDPAPITPDMGGTVYLCTADAEGTMVSYIQSNYKGSGIVIPNTGISLNNRAASFSMDPDDANCLEGGKRPYHTIIPGFLSMGSHPVGPFGIMGAMMQPQAHLQVVGNLVLDGLNPQEALDRPRWYWNGGKKVRVEPGFPADVVDKLKAAGHDIEVADSPEGFGRGQMILVNDEYVYCGATEPRTDGHVAVW